MAKAEMQSSIELRALADSELAVSEPPTPLHTQDPSPGVSRPESLRRLSGIEHGDDEGAEEPQAGHTFQSLPPADGGRQAWLFLTACFLVEALIWGFPFAFGVFQNYYSTHEPFAGSPNIAVIGTCAMGVMYFGAPVVVFLLRLVPRWSRYAPIGGLLTTCLALALSSFATNVGQLVATQGVMYAIGGAFTYMPCILYMDEWFVRRKGLSLGVMWSGTGLAGVVFPLLMEALLQSLGHKTTLRLWSGLLFVLSAPLAYFIKPRIPPSSAHSASYSLRNPLKNLRFLVTRPFLLFQLANVVEALGYFLPSIYLPSYARSFLGASAFPAAATLLFVNVANVFGCVIMGWFVDRWPVPKCLLLSSVGATVGCLLLWGLSSTLPVLYAFGAVYGLFAGSYTSAWPGIMVQITEKERSQGRGVDPSLVFGCLAAGRGVGNMVSGPLSEALVRGSPWAGEAGFGYGSGYGTMIVFTGITALLGGASYVWRQMGWL